MYVYTCIHGNSPIIPPTSKVAASKPDWNVSKHCSPISVTEYTYVCSLQNTYYLLVIKNWERLHYKLMPMYVCMHVHIQYTTIWLKSQGTKKLRMISRNASRKKKL